MGNGRAGRVREPKQGDTRNFEGVRSLFVPEKFVADKHAAAADNREDSALFANDFVDDTIGTDDQLAEPFKVIWRLREASCRNIVAHKRKVRQ